LVSRYLNRARRIPVCKSIQRDSGDSIGVARWLDGTMTTWPSGVALADAGAARRASGLWSVSSAAVVATRSSCAAARFHPARTTRVTAVRSHDAPCHRRMKFDMPDCRASRMPAHEYLEFHATDVVRVLSRRTAY